MSNTMTILWRELRSYFVTPVAYIFIVAFLFFNGLFTFQVSNLLENGHAGLDRFFTWHPWLYLFFIPAIAMRLWAEERKSGTIELLLTLPVSPAQTIAGKFIAAWVFIGISLALTFPVVLTVRHLGEPDMGVIWAGYFASFLMAGAYLAIGICMSALSKNQVVSFILAVGVCFGLIVIGYEIILDFFTERTPAWLIDAVASLSFLTHFQSMTRGEITMYNLLFFGSLIIGFLCACGIILEMKKAE